MHAGDTNDVFHTLQLRVGVSVNPPDCKLSPYLLRSNTTSIDLKDALEGVKVVVHCRRTARPYAPVVSARRRTEKFLVSCMTVGPGSQVLG